MNNTQDQVPSLKVVPPEQIKPPAKSSHPPVQEAMKPPEKPGINWSRILFLLVLGVGGFALSQMEVTMQVRGKATLKPLPQKTQSVYSEEGGKITNFMVKHGDWVQVGEVVAEVKNPDLEERILEEQSKLQEDQTKLTAATERIALLVTEYTVAEELVRSHQNQWQKSQEDVDRLSSDSPPHEIQIILHEIQSIDDQIAGLEKSIQNRQEQVQKSQDGLDQLRESGAIEEGALSFKYQNDLEQELLRITDDRDNYQSRVTELESQKQAKQANMERVKQNIERERDDRQDQLSYQQANREKAAQALRSAQIEKAQYMALVQSREKKIAELLAKSSVNQKLKAGISGRVVALDLSEKNGKWLDRREPVMQIIQMDQLEARIAFHPTDAALIEQVLNQGSVIVTLKPQQPEYDSFEAKVSDMEPVMPYDQTQQTPQLVVTATVENENKVEQWINNELYAAIEVEKMPLYKRVQRELMKVLKLRQHF